MARTLACWGAILSASLLLINLPQWTQSYRLESYNKFSDNLIQNNDDDQFKCSTGCIETSKSNRVIDYQTGTTYSYQVQLSTELKQGQGTYSNDVVDNNNSNSQVRIKAIADLSAYGQCEMVLRLKQIQIEGIDDQRQADQMKYQLAKHSTHFAIKNGQIEQVCAEHDETEWTVNVKKSILSSIQVSAENLTEKSEIIETDINGQCLTEYQPINEWKYGQDRNAIVEIIKRKQLSKCHNRHQINLGLFPRSYGLDQLVRSSMPIVNGTYECRQKIQDSVVIESDCRDKQSIWPLKVSVDSSIHCQLIGEQSILIAPKSTSRSMKRQNLAWNTAYSTNSLLQGSLQSSSQDAEYTVEQVEQLLKQLCRKTENSIDIEVPELFAQLVSVKQSLRAEEDQQLYEQIRNGQLCQSSTNKLHDIYLDASALAGTAGSVDVLIKAYQQQQQQQQRQQRQSEILPRFSYYFSLLAFTKVPSVEAAQRLVEFVQQQQQQQIVSNDEYEQIIYGVTGYLHNLRRFVQDQQEQQQGQQQHGQQEQISLENVEQVISRLQQYLIEQLEQLVPQVGQQQQQQQQQVNYTTVLSLIHGLENIGYELTTDYQQQQQLVQRVIRIVQQYGGGHQSKSVDYYTPIRVAIIRSIVNVVTDDDTVRNYLLELFFDQQHQESNAVRIEAYKTLVMSGVKISELQKIQKYVDSSNDDDGQLSTDVINYVRSHQANLRTTSDIYRRTILPLGAPKFSKPTSLIGVSRNYEFSYVNDVYQIGVTAEADIVYDNVYYGQTYRQRQTTNVIPQMVTFNLTLPIMGREFQVVQVRVYQQGLEQVFGSQYQQQSIHDKSTFDPMKMMTKLIDIVSRANGRQLLRENPQFTLYVQIQIDGKTVVAYDEQELITLINGHGMISRMLRDVFTRQQSTVSIDRAFSIVPIDFLTSMTTTTGMPVQFRLNSTVVVGLKANVNLNIDNNDSTNVDFEVWPSFVGQIDGSVKYYAGQQQEKSVQHTGRVYSAPHVNLQARFDGKQGVTLKSYMPEQRYTVLRYETGFYVNKQRQQSRSVGQGRSSMIIDRSSNTGSDKHQCTEFTKKLLGVALCYDVQYQNNDDDGQSTEFVTELSVEKFDQQLNSFEIHLDNPVTFVESIFGWSNKNNNNNGKRSLKFMFNTPGTEIDRETVFEVQLPSFDRDFLTSGARLRIKSPWKEMLAEAVVRNHQYDRTFSVQFSVDKHRFVQMEIGLETVQRGQKSEYRAKMIVNTPFTGQPINLVGTWSYQRGSKSVFHISLEDIEQQRSFVKGTWIKSGQISQNDFKWSSHLMFDLARIACKAIGTIEQGERDFKLNFSTDYQTPRSGRQSAQLSVKHQNLSYGKMIKLINEAQWSSTVAPKYNTQYNHRFIFGSNDYLEHDLQIKSNNNNEEQIRLFQSAKLMEQRGQYDGEIDSICTVKPLGIDYELKAQTSLVGWTNGGGENRRFELIATGNRRNQIDSDKLRAELYFQQQSSEPLKLTVRAAVKSEQIDFMYTDKVEEAQPNEYHGLMMVQLSPKQKYSTRYVYSVNQRDSKSNIHQLDATINDAITNKLFAKQQGKMIQSISDRSFDLQSKWTDEYGQRLFDGRLKVENGGHGGGQTKCQFEHYPTDTRGRFDLDSSKAVVEFENKQYKHMAKVDLDNERQFSLNSKTKQYDNDIFTIDTKISPKHRSYLKIDSESFNSDCHYEPESETGDRGKKSAKIQLQIPGWWEHETQTLMDNDNDRYELQSRTDYNNENVYDLNGKYQKDQTLGLALKTKSISSELLADKGKQYRLQFENDKFKHDTRLNCDQSSSSSSSSTIDFDSKTIKNNENIATIHYGCSQDRVHQFNVDCNGGAITAKGECQFQSTNEPFGHLNVGVNTDGIRMKHQTQIKANIGEQTAQMTSDTELSDKKLAQIKAAIARKPADQQPYATASVDLPQFNGQIGYEQQRNGFVDDDEDNEDREHRISCEFQGKQWQPQLKHRSQIKILKKRSIVDFDSETEWSNDKSDSLQVKGQYRHRDQTKPSQFNVKLGKILSTVGQINMFNDDEKTLDMHGHYYDDENGQKYEHESKIRYSPEQGALQMDGTVMNEIGKKIASIGSFLTTDTDKTSYLNVHSDDTERIPSVKIELNRRMKRAAIDVDMNQYHHKTMYQNDQSGVKVNTITTKDQQNVFNFNTEINHQPTAKSHFEVKVGPKYQTSVHVYPAKRSGSFSLTTPAVRHQTEFDLNQEIGGPANSVQSTTHYYDDLLASLDARMEGLRGENVIKANVPSVVRLDTTMDLPGKRFSFDAQADPRYGGRHVMGSIYANHVRRNAAGGQQDSQFHFDVAWDIDRDPKSRVLVDVNAQRRVDHSLKLVVRADYAHNKLVFETELTPKSVLANSARVSLSYIPYDNVDTWQLTYTHLNHMPQVECKFEFLYRNQLRYSTRVTSQITDERFAFGLQTTSPQHIEAQINVNVIGVYKGNGQYYTKVTGQKGVEDQYELEVSHEQDPNYRIYFGKVEVRIPKSESQSFEYRIDWPGKYVTVHTVSARTNNRFDLEAKIQPDRNVRFAMKSDLIYLPVIDTEVRYVTTDEPEFYAKLIVDQESLFESQYKVTGLESISSGQFHLLAKLQSVFTPSFEMTVDSRLERQADGDNDLVFTVEGKYNVEKVFYGNIKRVSSKSEDYGEQSLVFDMQGWISRPNGVKLVETASKFVFGQQSNSVLEYVLDIQPNRDESVTLEPIYVLVNGARKSEDPNKWIASIKITKGEERRDLIDADVVIQKGHGYGQDSPAAVELYGFTVTVPERVEATVRYVPTSTQLAVQYSFMEQLNVDQPVTKSLFDEQTIQPQLRDLRTLRKYRNEFVVTLDDRKIGYEIVSSKLAYRNTWQHNVRLHSPQSNGRSVYYRTAYHYAPETFTYVYRSELTYGYETAQPVYSSTQVVAPIPNKPTSYMVYYDLQSPILTGDGHVWAKAYWFGTENKYQGVVATLKTTQNDQITFEATTRTEEEQTNQMVYYGKTNRVTYYNVTVYTEDQRIDTGIDGYVSGSGYELNWHNQNRHGQRKTGQYQYRFLDNNRFEGVVEHDNYGLYFKGQLMPKQNVYVIDSVVEHYHKVISNTGRYYRGQSTTRQQHTEKQLIGQYKIHVEAKDQCLRADIVRDPTTAKYDYDQQQEQEQQSTYGGKGQGYNREGTYSQQLSFCMDDDQSNILNIAVDSIENGQKTTDLNVRLDTRQVVNSIILSLKWNPRYQQSYYGQIFEQLRRHTYDQSEIFGEIKHVVQTVRRILFEQQDGLSHYQNFLQQLIQTAEDFFGLDDGQVQQLFDDLVVTPVWQTIEYTYEIVARHGLDIDQYRQTIEQLVRKVQYECYQNDSCRQSVETIVDTVTKSPERLISLVSDYLVQALQHTHRFVSTSYTGNWIRSLIPTTLFDQVPELIHQINYYILHSYAKFVGGNYPLAEFIDNVEHVAHELAAATHWRQVQWHQVKESIGKIIKFTLTPWRYVSTTRVLVYDPQQGRLQIELYGPAVQHPRYYYEQIVRPGTKTFYDYFGRNNQSYQGYGDGETLQGGGYYYGGQQQQQQQQQSSIFTRLFGSD